QSVPEDLEPTLRASRHIRRGAALSRPRARERHDACRHGAGVVLLAVVRRQHHRRRNVAGAAARKPRRPGDPALGRCRDRNQPDPHRVEQPRAMTSAGAPAKQRVFVALWPADDVRVRLDAIGQQLALRAPAARRMTAANLHLTLAFIGWLASERVAELATAIATISIEPFTWQVDHVGHFARAHVVWVGGAANAALES